MRRFCLFAVALISVPYSADAASIRIEEVFFNPTGADTGFEYVVLGNSGRESVDVAGLSVYPDGVGYFTLPILMLAPNARVTIYLRATGTATDKILYHSGATSNMGNTSGSVALFSSSTHSKDAMIDFIQYGRSGETWESGAADIGLWTKGDVVAIEPEVEGKVLRRTGAGIGVSAWTLTDIALPASIPAEQTEVDSESANTYSGPTNVPTLRALAGGDQRGIAGGEIAFHASALGWHDEPLTSGHVRYVWNFGNGVLYEGKMARYTYAYPGVYTATLYITSGEQTARDDIKVTIVENPLSISRVESGVGGFVELTNPSGEKIDISGWRFAEGERIFIFPPHTLVAPKARVSIGNDILRFALDFSSSVMLAYPNGKIAMEYKQNKKIAAPLPANVSPKPTKVVIATSTLFQETPPPPEPLVASIDGAVLPTETSKTLWLFGSVAAGIVLGLGVVVIQKRVSRV